MRQRPGFLHVASLALAALALASCADRVDTTMPESVQRLSLESVGTTPLPKPSTAAHYTIDEETVVAACREALTNYKIPRQIRFVDDVPVTLSGKVLRRQLREDHFG